MRELVDLEQELNRIGANSIGNSIRKLNKLCFAQRKNISFSIDDKHAGYITISMRVNDYSQIMWAKYSPAHDGLRWKVSAISSYGDRDKKYEDSYLVKNKNDGISVMLGKARDNLVKLAFENFIDPDTYRDCDILLHKKQQEISTLINAIAPYR